jgi:16S rRNA processing protein RimM
MGKEKHPIEITKISGNNDKLIASLKNITDRNQAETLAGQSIYVLRESLPNLSETEFYQHDLIGMEVRKDNEPFGNIMAFHNFGAGELIEIRLNTGEEKIFPFDKKTIPEINLAQGYVAINTPEEI